MKKETTKKHKNKRRFRHFNQLDRDRIEALLKSGHKQKEIADILGFDPGALSREINKRKRKNGVYDSETAQHKASMKRSNSKYQGMKIEKHPELKKQIIEGLVGKRSPDEIAGRMKEEKQTTCIGTNAIYKWLYSCWGQPYCRLLCTKRHKKRQQKKKTRREMIPNRIPIDQRPKYGVHAEGDIFVSPIKTGSQQSGAVICIPDTKLLVGTKINNKKPAVMRQAVEKMIMAINISDLTMDNGIENRDHQQFGISTYFCHPHSPWQKPHVENGIGLIRRWFFPKKTDLKNVSEEELQNCFHVLNNKYRKSLGYRSAYEVSLERGMIQKTPVFNGIKLMQKVAFH